MPDTTHVFDLRGQSVMTAARAAEAFGVATREIVQNITRNPELFAERYAFQVTESEQDRMRSLGVIPKAGRGGSRALPWVVTQKGAIRLATLMKSPRAIEAADLFIDIFADVLRQLHAGQRQVAIASPSRIAPDKREQTKIARLRGKVMDAMDDLLDTIVDPAARTTVRQELAETKHNALGHVQAILKARQLGNDQTEAQTLLLLEQVRDMAERRGSELQDAALARESRALENLQRKIGLVRDLLVLLDQVEPNAVVELLGDFAPALPSPKKVIE